MQHVDENAAEYGVGSTTRAGRLGSCPAPELAALKRPPDQIEAGEAETTGETATPATLMARTDGRTSSATTLRHSIGEVGHQNEEPTKDKDAKRIRELESTRETSADSPRAAAQSPTRRRTSRCRPSESTIGVFRLWDGGH